MLSRVPVLLLLACLIVSHQSVCGLSAADNAKIDPKLAKDLEPKRVTLKAEEIALSKALRMIQDQTGFEVLPPADEDPTLKNIKLDKVPFWEALDTLAKSADLRVYPYGRDRKITFMKHERGYREMPTCYSGPFRIVFKKIILARDLENDAQGGIAYLEVAWEPRFQAFYLEPKPDSLEVKDDRGTVLEVPPGGKGRGPTGEGLTQQVEVPLPAFPRKALRIGSIQGEVTIVGSPKLLTFTFDKLAKGQEQTQDGVTVGLRTFKEAKELWTIDVGLKYPAETPKLESFETFWINNQAYLVNKAGMRMEPAGYDADDQTVAGQQVIRYRFTDDDAKQLKLGKSADWKLIYRTPAQIAEVPIKFSFKDVPLP
jgi:hypothetical protein